MMRTPRQRLIEHLSFAGFGAWLATSASGDASVYICGIATGLWLASAAEDALDWIKEGNDS